MTPPQLTFITTNALCNLFESMIYVRLGAPNTSVQLRSRTDQIYYDNYYTEEVISRC